MSVIINREVLLAARENQLWTQEDLAAASGLSARTIQRIEARGRCSKDSLQALSAALNISAIEFIFDAESVEADEVEISRNWIWGPILGSIGGLLGCSVGGMAVIRNIQETQADMSTALPALSFIAIMTAFAIGFPAFMTYKYWNVTTQDYCAPYKFSWRN